MRTNPLLALYARNAGVQGRRFAVRAERNADEATVYLYDVIVADQFEAEWFGGIDPLTFAKTLAGISAKTIHLRINSPGGSAFAARAMESTIRDHGARFVAHIDGYAASSASYVMLAADEVEMSPGAMVMVHKGWTYAWGNADELMSTAALLEKFDGTMIDTYVKATGQTREQIAAWVAAETWFTAQEAVDAGFADRIAGEDDGSANALAWDLSVFERAPQASAPPAADAGKRDRQRQRLRALLLTPNR